MKTDQELETIYAEGNRLSRKAALRAVYDAGFADVSRGYTVDSAQAFDHDGDGKPGGSKAKAKRAESKG